MNGVRTSAWAKIDGSCEIEHDWLGDEVVLTFTGDRFISVELCVTDDGFDRLIAVVEQARTERDKQLREAKD